MLLEALYKLHERLETDESYGLPRIGRSIQKIGVVVVLRPDGSLVNLEVREEPLRVEVLGVTKPPGSGLNPCFLWDSIQYALAWVPRDDPQRERKMARAARAFEAFRDRHLEVQGELDVPAFRSVCNFLGSWCQELAESREELAEYRQGFVVFQLRGEERFVHEYPEIQAWWDARTEGDPERMKAWWETGRSGEGAEGVCLVTGRRARLARLHEKIKGIAGAQSSGAALVGFNLQAFESHGLSQSYNAPVAEDVARKYVLALNALLEGPMRRRHRVVVGDLTTVFWTERPSVMEDVFAALVGQVDRSDANAQDEVVLARVRAVLDSLRRGRPVEGDLASETAFHLVGLAAPTPARVAVRFHVTGSLELLLERLRRHLRDTAMEGSRKGQEDSLSLWAFASAAAGSDGKTPGPLVAGLFESIFNGRNYPDAIYRRVLDRLRAEASAARRSMTEWARAALIRGWLVRNRGKEVPVTLDKERKDVAYRLGRLFAVLEMTQRDALGRNINATIRDRFYGAASTTPAVVFPRLLRVYQHHLAKLDGGRKVIREKLVQEILDPIDGFPRHLDLEGQGMFALGYYHQVNDFYRKAEENDAAGAAEESE